MAVYSKYWFNNVALTIVLFLLALLFIMQPKGSSSAAAVAELSSTETKSTTHQTPAPPPPTTTNTHSTTTGIKTVYLIRHAESEENRRIAALSRTFRTLGKFSFPKTSDLSASTELLNIPGQVDSNVSDIGAKQIAHMGEKLNHHNFVVTAGIQLVAHSPLLRARKTSEGMLGCLAPPATTSSSSSVAAAGEETLELKAQSVSRVLETNLLLEKTPAEWTPLYYSSFKRRIGEFEDWLGKQEEETIALVGHSQFFKAMLGVDFKFGNCEVWKVDFDSSKSITSHVDDGPSQGTTPLARKESMSGSMPSRTTTAASTTCQWTLPRQWSNLEKIFGCDVESSPKTA
jgi:broad specificity phosphatase PhoE